MNAYDIHAWLARRPPLIFAAATLATVVAYGPSLHGPFLFDDLSEIVDNPAIRTLLPPWRPMFEGGELPHRPIPYLSFAVNYQLGRMLSALFGTTPLDPLPFHLVNVAIHLLNGWLLWCVLSLLLVPHRHAAGGFPSPSTVAAAATVIWLVHPLQSQAVSYIYQRIELLAACATLTTCVCFLRATTSPRPLPWMAVAVTACGMGMACKEWVVVVPPALLLLDRAFLSTSWQEVLSRRGAWHILLFATWPILLYIVTIQRARYPEAGFSSWQSLVYAANQPAVILWYLSRIVIPSGLSIDHGAVLRKDLVGRDAWLLLPAACALAAASWAAISLPRRPAAAFAILTFLLLLAPTSSILPVQDVCVEHRMYLAAAIPITVTVIAVANYTHLVIPITAALTVFCASMTAARNTVYHSPMAAWHDAVVKSGGSSRSLSRYGTELSKLDRHAEAVAACAAAVNRNPVNPVPYAALAATLLNADEPERAAAVCTAGLAELGTDGSGFRDPVIDRLGMYLGLALDRLGDPTGVDLLRRAVERMPESLSAKEHLARVLVRTDPPAAAAIWFQVAAASPDDAYVAFNLGSAVARFDPAAAIALLDRALALDGKNPDAHNNLGNAFLALGRHAEAADAYRRCLELAPGHPQAAANLRVVGEARP